MRLVSAESSQIATPPGNSTESRPALAPVPFPNPPTLLRLPATTTCARPRNLSPANRESKPAKSTLPKKVPSPHLKPATLPPGQSGWNASDKGCPKASKARPARTPGLPPTPCATPRARSGFAPQKPKAPARSTLPPQNQTSETPAPAIAQRQWPAAIPPGFSPKAYSPRELAQNTLKRKSGCHSDPIKQRKIAGFFFTSDSPSSLILSDYARLPEPILHPASRITSVFSGNRHERFSPSRSFRICHDCPPCR